MRLTIVQKTTENANLPHKFKRPLTINIHHRQDAFIKKGAVLAGKALLTPVAVAIDVVAFPVMCGVVLCGVLGVKFNAKPTDCPPLIGKTYRLSDLQGFCLAK